ncbi:hypothetical protein OQA88_12212 [Cercophora sp. LCS_1]
MSVPRARLLDLMKARCELFSTTFNPDGIRMGNKILRQRLKGPSIAAYYPRRVVTIKDFENAFKPLDLLFDNERELERLDHLERLKARGKGAPKKKKGPPVQKGKK